MSDHSHFLDRGLAMTTPHPLGERIVRAEGCWMETESGERLFDMVSGIGVSSLGHGHPAIRRALQEQLDRHLHVMVYGEIRPGGPGPGGVELALESRGHRTRCGVLR